MGFFRKRAAAPALTPEELAVAQDAAIADFWAWWAAEGEARATRLFDGDGTRDGIEALGEEIGRRVEAIAPLAFETGHGTVARHVLVVTAAGDPELRPVADRWLAAAPAPGEAFEYASWRQPVADAVDFVIGYGKHEVGLAEAAVVTLTEGPKVHVQVAHPRFASMPDEARGQVTFLFLDALLGERVVEESIGEVSWVARAGEGAVPLTDLPAIVARVRRV